MLPCSRTWLGQKNWGKNQRSFIPHSYADVPFFRALSELSWCIKQRKKKAGKSTQCIWEETWAIMSLSVSPEIFICTYWQWAFTAVCWGNITCLKHCANQQQSGLPEISPGNPLETFLQQCFVELPSHRMQMSLSPLCSSRKQEGRRHNFSINH